MITLPNQIQGVRTAFKRGPRLRRYVGAGVFLCWVNDVMLAGMVASVAWRLAASQSINVTVLISVILGVATHFLLMAETRRTRAVLDKHQATMREYIERLQIAQESHEAEQAVHAMLRDVAPPASRPGGFLEWYSWFCPHVGDDLRATAGNLRKDVRAMRKQGCGRAHILAVRFWITTTTIVPIIWDGCVRVSKKLPLLGSAVRAASAFLRWIDPPKLG